MGILASILAKKRLEIASLGQASLPLPPTRRPLDLRRKGGTLRLIAEIKYRSPSAGTLSRFLGVGERAAAYEEAGAALISVLTDADFFGGEFAHLTLARQKTTLPLLCKDFILDEKQLDMARAYGADAVLLIVRCLEKEHLAALTRAAEQRDLEAMVEVADEEEARIALGAGARWIGVNARDLDTLEMNSARAERVLAGLPAPVTRVHLSGLKAREGVLRIARSGADAALVGEVLMREDDPRSLLREFVAAAKSA